MSCSNLQAGSLIAYQPISLSAYQPISLSAYQPISLSAYYNRSSPAAPIKPSSTGLNRSSQVAPALTVHTSSTDL